MTLSYRNRLGAILLDAGEYGRAETICREVLESSKEELADDNDIAVVASCNLAVIFKFQGRSSDAEETIRPALDSAKKIPGANGKHL